MSLDLTKPLKLLPNIRWEPAQATTGYTWGKPASQSNILAMISEPARSALGIPEDSIVAERWLCTDDRGFPSQVILDNGETMPLSELLESEGEQLVGPSHLSEFGPYLGSLMKQLDTHPDSNRGSLSVQLHPKPGHPTRPSKPEMWQGQGTVYLGWNQDMTPAEIRATIDASQLEDYMNVIELTPDSLVLVTGGLIHAIRYNSFLSEWSMAPGRDDIAKGNIKDATVAPYDRTDGKTPRPGKEDFEGTMEVMTHANTFSASSPNDLLAKPMVLQDDVQNQHLALFRTPIVFVDQYQLTTELSLSLADRGKPIFVKSGAIEIWHNGQKLDYVAAGEERYLPHAMGEVLLKNPGTTRAEANVWYTPLPNEIEKLLAVSE